MASPDDQRPASPDRVDRSLCTSNKRRAERTCAYGWTRAECAARRRLAAETPDAVIETPCWIAGAATAEDLELVHVWNAMAALRADADADDVPTSAAVAT